MCTSVCTPLWRTDKLRDMLAVVKPTNNVMKQHFFKGLGKSAKL